MHSIFRFPQAVRQDPDVKAWLRARDGELGAIARVWFQTMRECGDDVRELLHDGHPTACVNDAAFAYVDLFKAHVNVGFYRGAEIPDPDNLLAGTGKLMRHVKLSPFTNVDSNALQCLIRSAYDNMKEHGASGLVDPVRD